MKRQLCTVLGFVLLSALPAACIQQTNSNKPLQPAKKMKHVVIKLADTLGSVAIDLPVRYDTFFTWTNHSDCGASCDKIEYRYQPKGLRITKESGFIWLGEPRDSIEKFTVIHSGYLVLPRKIDSMPDWADHAFLKERVLSDPRTAKVKSDTLEKINNQPFSIIIVDNYDTTERQYFKKLLATTFIRGNEVSFGYELLTKQNDFISDSFLQNALESLKTVRIVK